MEVVVLVIVGVIGAFLSFPMEAVIKRCISDEKILTKSITSDFKFNPCLMLVSGISLIIICAFMGVSFKFFVYAVLFVVLIMDMFADIRAQIIPNALNMFIFIVGIIYTYIMIIIDSFAGLDLFLRYVCWCWNIYFNSIICYCCL